MDPNEEENINLPPEGEPAAPAPEAPAAPEAEEPEAPSQEEEPEGGEEEPVSTGSPRLDKRIEKFSLKLRNSWATQDQPSPGKPYQPADLSEMEYDPETLELLEEDRKKIAEDAYQRGAGSRQAEVQERFMDRFEIDADRVTAKYSMLSEDSEDFDPDLTAGINENYLALVGYTQLPDGRAFFRNPVIRYKDYVDAQMALIERASSSRNASTATEVAKQASRTGVRPGGASRKATVDLTPEGIRKMSPEEYEKHRPAIEAEIRRSMGI